MSLQEFFLASKGLVGEITSAFAAPAVMANSHTRLSRRQRPVFSRPAICPGAVKAAALASARNCSCAALTSSKL